MCSSSHSSQRCGSLPPEAPSSMPGTRRVLIDTRGSYPTWAILTEVMAT